MPVALTSLLVGSHFRPPAKQVLAVLPAGCQLLLDPEPENPYDASAIKILVDPKEIPQEQHEALAEELPACGLDLADVLGQDSIQLGYVASSEGKPLAKSQIPGIVGNKQFLTALAAGPDWKAELAFSPVNGDPLVKLTLF